MSHPHPPAARRPGLLGAALVVLALWVQGLAPAAALRMAAADPLAGAVICGRAGPPADAAAVAERSAPVPACGLCRLCCAGLAAPTPPRAPDVARPATWITLVWPLPPPPRAARPSRHPGQPRGPPRLA